MLAGTKPDRLICLQLEADGSEIGAGMGTVAIRLVSGPTTTAPPVFSGFQIDFDRLFTGHNGFTH